MIEKHISLYYRTERIASIVFATFGAITASGGLFYYLLNKHDLSTGIMLGLSLVGTYQIIVGLVRFYRSFRRFDDSRDSAKFGNHGFLKDKEYHRLRVKEQNIIQVRKLILAALLTGFIILAFCVFSKTKGYLLGTAVGLTLHTGFLLCFDLFSQFRIQEYLRQLQKKFNLG